MKLLTDCCTMNANAETYKDSQMAIYVSDTNIVQNEVCLFCPSIEIMSI